MDDTPQVKGEFKARSRRGRILFGGVLWLGFAYFTYLALQIDFVTLRVMPYIGMLLFFVAAVVHVVSTVVPRIPSAGWRRFVGVLKWPLAIVLSVFVLRGVEALVMRLYLTALERELSPLTLALQASDGALTPGVVRSLPMSGHITDLAVLQGEGVFSVEVSLPAIDIDGYVAYFAPVTNRWYYYHNDVPGDLRPSEAGVETPEPLADIEVKSRSVCRRGGEWRCEPVQ